MSWSTVSQLILTSSLKASDVLRMFVCFAFIVLLLPDIDVKDTEAVRPLTFWMIIVALMTKPHISDQLKISFKSWITLEVTNSTNLKG